VAVKSFLPTPTVAPPHRRNKDALLIIRYMNRWLSAKTFATNLGPYLIKNTSPPSALKRFLASLLSFRPPLRLDDPPAECQERDAKESEGYTAGHLMLSIPDASATPASKQTRKATTFWRSLTFECFRTTSRFSHCQRESAATASCCTSNQSVAHATLPRTGRLPPTHYWYSGQSARPQIVTKPQPGPFSTSRVRRLQMGNRR